MRSFCPYRAELRHPLTLAGFFGRQVGLEAIEQCADGVLASVEVEPGLIVKIPISMLGPASCAGMEIGAPRVFPAALAMLHELLVDGGFRQSPPRWRNH